MPGNPTPSLTNRDTTGSTGRGVVCYMVIFSAGLPASVCALLAKGQSTCRGKADGDQSHDPQASTCSRDSELRFLRACWAWPTSRSSGPPCGDVGLNEIMQERYFLWCLARRETLRKYEPLLGLLFLLFCAMPVTIFRAACLACLPHLSNLIPCLPLFPSLTKSRVSPSQRC